MPTAVAEGVFVVRPDGARLIAGRRKQDGEMRFPMPTGPEADLYEPVELAPEGRLWSFTVQRFRPKTPPYVGDDDDRSFKPFAVGYVEFPGQVIVEGRILIDDFGRLRLGQPMRVDLETFPTSTRGQVATYAFRPAS
ncbi:MAG TPA: OB-fold domain-containing protein [Caulobacteraceae bacterium]|nr:OB-fold domain-containing protein [Caulobacteraceae bacterium]